MKSDSSFDSEASSDSDKIIVNNKMAIILYKLNATPNIKPTFFYKLLIFLLYQEKIILF